MQILFQLVSEPTHSHGNILDLVLSDSPDLISDLTVDPYTCKDISDHYLVYFYLSTSKSSIKAKARYIFNYSKADIDCLVSHMADVNLNHCLSLLDADQIWARDKERNM